MQDISVEIEIPSYTLYSREEIEKQLVSKLADELAFKLMSEGKIDIEYFPGFDVNKFYAKTNLYEGYDCGYGWRKLPGIPVLDDAAIIQEKYVNIENYLSKDNYM